MPRPRSPIVPHPGPAEIARRSRACRDGVAKPHRQVLWLLTRPGPPPAPAEVAARVGLTPSWARTILKRWDAEGPAGLAGRRAGPDGGRPVLSDERPAALFEAIPGRPADGGPRAGPRVAAYARDRRGVTARVETGRRWLNRRGFSPRVPRPRNPKAATAQEPREWERGPGRPDGRAAPRVPRQAGRAVGRG